MESSTWTKTQKEQRVVEGQVFQIYNFFYSIPPNSQSVMLEIQRDMHLQYLSSGLRGLGPSFSVLDANRPWLCYWMIHSISVLGESIEDELKDDVIDFLSRCQDPNGGYGGGPGQMPHLATTYAAVNTLITLGGQKSFSSIKREKLHSFLLRMKEENGGFRMHDGGEVDVRACYTAISVASILNILDAKLTHNAGNFIVSCQSYEGGIAGEPGSEAHGGYTFCGLAAMALMNEVNRLDLQSLIDWMVFRQGVEGGFQGRTNKLVDGCYSFWQGGVAAILQRLCLDAADCESSFGSDRDESVVCSSSDGEDHLDGTLSHSDEVIHLGEGGAGPEHDGAVEPVNLRDISYDFISGQHASRTPLFDSIGLQRYIILCSQHVDGGGFRDKPGKPRDHYHTCYCLSGLSISQYIWAKDFNTPPFPGHVLGPYSNNLVERIHPLFNIVIDRYYEARQFFSSA
ncbi:hypothetical protein DM860_008605 [Cuscuta australis]|uniref:Protein farnesyltransferase subunit beta n=1 Tax=Cuscuta australis TaxID=267555 RepID=A0A328D537_9ASTE|nr:hypothetical protein DM860_008605 [Cuscuta australis]